MPSFASAVVPVQPRHHVRLAVTDTGNGMSEEIRSRALELFFTTKEASLGTGRGLSTGDGIVRQCDGFLQLETEPRRGTTVRSYLPFVQAAVEATDNVRTPSGSAHGVETILTVDDDVAIRLLARRALQRFGYTVLDAEGIGAFDAARQYPGIIHLLLTDVVTPGTSGPPLAKALLAVRPGLRVTYMSGNVSRYHDKISEAPGAYLKKALALQAAP